MRLFTLQSIIFIIIFSAVISISGCSKDEKNIEFSFVSHKSNDVTKRPLPIKIKGKIINFNDLSEEQKGKNLNIYLIEQSTKELIWHIEPKGKVDDNGNWEALTWLGNRRQGNKNLFNVCIFASKERLKLNNGDHPVKEKPDNIGETCIELKRID